MDAPGLPFAPLSGSGDALGVGDLRRRLAGSTPDEAAKRLEALFATLLVKELRRGLPNGFFGGSTGSDTYDGWLDEHLGETLASSGALDLAGRIRTSLAADQAREAAEREEG